MKYGCQRFSTLARIGGANYRVLARLDHHRSAHYERLWAMWTRLNLPMELWLGRGRPLNPYLRGVIIDYLCREMRPRELILAPEHLFEMPGMRDMLEWTLLRSWGKSWLHYCHWYYKEACAPGVSIEEFFKSPVVNRKWKIDRTDPELVRFGLMWKVYDMVALKGIDFRLPILDVTPTTNTVCGYLLGGVAGTNFLVFARGLNQPRAGHGVVYPGNYQFHKKRGRSALSLPLWALKQEFQRASCEYWPFFLWASPPN